MKKIFLLFILFAFLLAAISCANVTDADQPVDSTGTGAALPAESSELTAKQPLDSSESTTDNYIMRDFEPGVILLGLKEPCKKSISELFPSLNIAEIEDIHEKLYNRIKDQPDKKAQSEEIKSKIGTEFVVRLRDTSTDAVLAAIALLENNPIVAYATPNYVINPDT